MGEVEVAGGCFQMFPCVQSSVVVDQARTGARLAMAGVGLTECLVGRSGLGPAIGHAEER